MPTALRSVPAIVRRWLDAVEQVSAIAVPVIEAERILRGQVIQKFFPRPQENTNLVDCADGVLSLKQPYKRAIDEPHLALMYPKLIEAGVPVEDLITWQPKLNIMVYRNLSAKHRKLFDKCLSITYDSPSLRFIDDPKG